MLATPARSLGTDFESALGLNPESFDLEEFCWRGVAPTPEAERQIIEYAAEVGYDWIEKLEDDPERLREQLMMTWTMTRPVGGHNRFLLVPELLGPYGFDITCG